MSLRWLLGLLFTAALAAGSAHAQGKPPAHARVQLLGINDFHGQLVAGKECSPVQQVQRPCSRPIYETKWLSFRAVA